MMKKMLSLLLLSALLGTTVAFVPLRGKKGAFRSRSSVCLDSSPYTNTNTYAGQQVERGVVDRPSNDGLGEFNMDDWKWCYTSNTAAASCSYVCEEMEGRVPADLRGTLFRNGPGNFERGNRRYEHTLDGDGFIASWRFGDDHVEYRGSFVETDYYLKEKEQDRILYRNTFGTQREGGILANALDVKLKNVANTNVVSFGDRVFALWEAGKPYELDPETLQTLPDSCQAPFDELGKPDCMRGVTIDNGGLIDQAVNVGKAFTAHPHQVNDDTIAAFSWAMNPTTNVFCLEFAEFDSSWCRKQKISYEIKDCPMAPHDFCISSDYYAFFENSMSFDMGRFIIGAKGPGQVLTQALHKPCRLHVVPRREGTGEAFQLDIPNFFCIHNSALIVENSENNTLTIFSSGWDLSDENYYPKGVKEVPFLGSWGGEFPNFEVIPPSMLFRTTVNMNTQSLVDHSAVIPGLNFEHPHVDSRDPSIIYGPCCNVVGLSTAPCGWCRIDTRTNTVKVWWTETRMFTEELVVVPKRDPRTNQLVEGCWLLGVMHDAETKRSSLAILNGDDIEQGPVCRIPLKHSLAFGLHGSFARSRD
jgi:all-trans-8'-apo-beta-carotenal 15,15'-oxygenase